MKAESIKTAGDKYLMNTYGERQAVFVRGKGGFLWDDKGRRYLDMVTGIAVCVLGHCHPAVVRAIRKQAGTLIHASNLYYVKPQAEFAQMLAENSFADRVFFANSGAEANEAAIKLSRKFGAPGNRHEIITMEGSFHGRTIATLTATGQEKIKPGFAPYLPGFVTVPFNSLESVREALTGRTVGVMVEPIQGERGNRVSSLEFISGLRKLCDERNLLLIFDEVQCGFGRTGKLFAYEHYGVSPDIMTLAKPAGGGLPLGAMLAKEKVAEVFTPGTHASTFGGNPVACAGGIATLEVILRENLLERACRLGEHLFEGLNVLKAKYDSVVDVRGKGLMAGLELAFPGKAVVEECFNDGLLLNCTSENFIRFLPALNVREKHLDEAVRVLDGVLKRI